MKTKSMILLLAALFFCSVLILQYGCKKDEDEPEQNKPPTAVFTIDPTLGPTSTIFEFDASGCFDPEEPISVLKVRWDWENNGNWDTDWSNDKTKNHQYSSEDTYTVKMEVKDTEGLTDNTTHSLTVDNSGGRVVVKE
jgi:PKD repeat protein